MQFEYILLGKFVNKGVSYNHDELNFYINGQKLDCPFTNVKGTVYPALYGNAITKCHKIAIST